MNERIRHNIVALLSKPVYCKMPYFVEYLKTENRYSTTLRPGTTRWLHAAVRDGPLWFPGTFFYVYKLAVCAHPRREPWYANMSGFPAAYFTGSFPDLYDLHRCQTAWAVIIKKRQERLQEMKILVAHRQYETVEVIRSVLSRINPVLLHAESGLDGLLTSRIELFDMIICGTDLPVVTGFEMIRSMRNNSINHRTPVVFITAEPGDGVTHLSNALHATALIAEADIPAELFAIVAGSSTAPGAMKRETSGAMA